MQLLLRLEVTRHFVVYIMYLIIGCDVLPINCSIHNLLPRFSMVF